MRIQINVRSIMWPNKALLIGRDISDVTAWSIWPLIHASILLDQLPPSLSQIIGLLDVHILLSCSFCLEHVV